MIYGFLLVYWIISPFWTISFVLFFITNEIETDIWHWRNKFQARELLDERVYSFYILVNSTKLLSNSSADLYFLFENLYYSLGWRLPLIGCSPTLWEVFPRSPPQRLCGETEDRIRRFAHKTESLALSQYLFDYVAGRFMHQPSLPACEFLKGKDLCSFVYFVISPCPRLGGYLGKCVCARLCMCVCVCM